MAQKSVNTTGSGDKTIVDVATGERNGVLDYTFFVAGAGTLILKDEAGNEFARYAYAGAGDGATLTWKVEVASLPNGPRFFTAGDIVINLSAATAVTGHITYAA